MQKQSEIIKFLSRNYQGIHYQRLIMPYNKSLTNVVISTPFTDVLYSASILKNLGKAEVGGSNPLGSLNTQTKHTSHLHQFCRWLFFYL